jgi:hypothetical protein
MDILGGLREKLRFIERFYNGASASFSETKRKIEGEEPPFVPRPFDPDRDSDTEPPFLTEWEDADDAISVVGQAALSLVQASLREYLDAFIELSRIKLPAGKGDWFARYKAFFLERYGIDWDAGPVLTAQIEEINLTRNDIHHTGREFGMTRRQSREHYRRFPDGIFTDEYDRRMYAGFEDPKLRIYVTAENLREAIRRVEVFCEFLEKNRRFF